MDFIRFHCPACSVALTVPPAAAGFRGPCPKCSIEIIGPNPALGLAASLPEVVPPPAQAFDPFPEKPAPAATPQEPAPELIPPTDPFAGSPEPPVAAPNPTAEPAPQAVAKLIEDSPPSLEPAAEKEEKPFEDFTPPTSEEERPTTSDTPAPTPPQEKSSRAVVLILSCLLCGVLAFVAGFTAGRKLPDPGSPIYSTKQADPPAAPPEPIPVPVRTWIPDVTTDESGEPRSAGPEATLNAFLNADGWAARSAYVMFPESIRERMEAHSKKSDDGPIETIDVSLFEITEQAHIFTISTSKVPEGFPVAVSRDGNSWLVDWETFVEFHDDRFNRFANGKEGEHGIFHLLAKPAKSEGKDALFERFLLNHPMPGREQSAYIKKGTVALARIQRIFDSQAGQSLEDFDKLLENQGPPLVLALSYKVNSEGQSYLQIEDVIAIGWGPGKP